MAAKKRGNPEPEDPGERTDADGRVLYPWEVSPDQQVVAAKVEEPAAEPEQQPEQQPEQ